MAIVLDQRVMGRPPVIQSAIGANGQITMGGKDLAGRAGSRARASRRLASGAAQGRRHGPDRRRASARTRSRRGLRAGIIAIAPRRPHHGRLLPLRRRARGRRVSFSTSCTRWPRSPASTRCSRSRARRIHPLDRYRGRRQRPDLRAHSRGARPRQDDQDIASTKDSVTR